MDLDSSIGQGSSSVFAVSNPIFDDPWFQRVYQHILRELIEGPFSSTNVEPFIDELSQVLQPELNSDPFISAGSVASLKTWMRSLILFFNAT